MAASRRRLATLLAGLGAAACGARIGLDRRRAEGLRRIGVVTPAVSAAPSAPTEIWLNAPFGHIGRFVDAALEAERERLLAWALASAGYDAGGRWTAHLTAALATAGFRPVAVPAARFDLAFLDHYPAAEVEAYLDTVVPEYGFIADAPEGPYIPYAMTELRFVLPGGRVLLQDRLVLNAFRPFGAQRVAGPAGPGFANAEQFPYDFARAAAGVDAALRAMAGRVAERLH